MIIIGYPGIGKSTVCGRDTGIIDLESSYFSQFGENWERNYVKLALELNRAGFDVCVSSHEKVIDDLILMTMPDDNVIAIFPDKSLKKLWIKKLDSRWRSSAGEGLPRYIVDKNERALERAEKYFDKDISMLMAIPSPFYEYHIMQMDYDLLDIIRAFKKTREAEKNGKPE